MNRADFYAALRFSIPQTVTALRLFLGVWALFAATLHHLELAAILIIVGVVTDALDGALARRFKVTSEFGALFDYFADYLCYVVVPAILSLQLVGGIAGFLTCVALGLPLFTGAARYARNTSLAKTQAFDEVGIPGLGTIFYAFFIIALVLLASEGAVGTRFLSRLLMIAVPVFSFLMLVPVRYPKLVKYKSILVPVVLGLNLMPFVLTTFLATCTVALIFIYVVFSPLVVDQRPGRITPSERP
jgi:CDP-diacylglycerol--serine O-phosphatidyltransferase